MEIVQQLKRIQNVSYSCNEEITAHNFSQNLMMDSLLPFDLLSLIPVRRNLGISHRLQFYFYICRASEYRVFQLETREEII